MKTQNLASRYDRKWAGGVTRTGRAIADDDKLVRQSSRLDVARVVHWRQGKTLQPVMKFGASYWSRKPKLLVDEQLNFLLAIGFSYNEVVELIWVHQSTAGRSKPNGGFDVVQLAFTMRF
jgi:hypothetical protein